MSKIQYRGLTAREIRLSKTMNLQNLIDLIFLHKQCFLISRMSLINIMYNYEVIIFKQLLSLAVMGIHFWLSPKTNQKPQGCYNFLTLLFELIAKHMKTRTMIYFSNLNCWFTKFYYFNFTFVQLKHSWVLNAIN